VTAIEQVQLGAGDIFQVRPGSRLGEEAVVAAPRKEKQRLVRAQPSLPHGVEGDVGLVVVLQVEHGLRPARAVHPVLIQGPTVGADQLRIGGAIQVLSAGGGRRECPADLVFHAWPVRPVLHRRLHIGPQADFVRVAIF
jgi:hypothetical protein